MNCIPSLKPAGWGPEPFIPQPGRRKPSPPIITVNGNGPDEYGNVKIPCVTSVNGYTPVENGSLRIPRTFYGSGAPSFVAGCIEGDMYFDRTSRHLWHFTLVGAALRWVEQSAGAEGDIVTSVNGQTGDVVLPEETVVAEAPSGSSIPSKPEGYDVGDSLFCTADNSRWVLVSATGGTYRWVRQDRTDAASTAIGNLAAWLGEHDVTHMKDSEKTALLQKLVAYVKAKEGIS